MINNNDSQALIALSYAPSLAFANMFSIFYLQVLSSIRKYNDNTESFALGNKVNNLVTFFYILSFALLFILQCCYNNSTNSTQKNLALVIIFLRQALFTYPNPFVDSKIGLTIFDLYRTVTSIALFAHQIILLFIAKEQVLIFVDESTKQSMSKMLDDKRYSSGDSRHYLL